MVVTNNKYIVTFKLYVPINYNFYEKVPTYASFFKKCSQHPELPRKTNQVRENKKKMKTFYAA